MADKIKIDIVSDVVCPWCTVGYKRLEKAIAELGIYNWDLILNKNKKTGSA